MNGSTKQRRKKINPAHHRPTPPNKRKVTKVKDKERKQLCQSNLMAVEDTRENPVEEAIDRAELSRQGKRYKAP